MDQIDFGFIGTHGFTIYRSCFGRYLNARLALKKPESECSKLIPKLEETFFWLVEEGKKNGFDKNGSYKQEPFNFLECLIRVEKPVFHLYQNV